MYNTIYFKRRCKYNCKSRSEDCCHVTGMCSGNTVESENVVCSNGVLKENSENINITSDNSEDDCCDAYANCSPLSEITGQDVSNCSDLSNGDTCTVIMLHTGYYSDTTLENVTYSCPSNNTVVNVSEPIQDGDISLTCTQCTEQVYCNNETVNKLFRKQ